MRSYTAEKYIKLAEIFLLSFMLSGRSHGF